MKNESSTLAQELRDVTKSQVAASKGIPDKVADYIVPVIDINPKHARVLDIVKSASNTTGSTVFTVSQDMDAYIVGCMLSAASTTAGTNTLSANVKLFGDSSDTTIASIRMTVTALLDAAFDNQVVMLPNPIKLARGSTLNTTVGGTLASARVTFFGYYVQNSGA